MNKLFSILILAFLLIPLTSALALDPTCEKILNAGESRTKVPAWQSVTELKSKIKVEAMKVDGQFYSRMNGKAWTKSPVNLDEAERSYATQAKNGTIKLSECKDEGSAEIDGVDANVISYKIELQGKSGAAGKIFVGKADGLPCLLFNLRIKSKYLY